MATLKLLFITKDRSQQLERSTHYLLAALKKQLHLMVWTEHGYLPNIVSQLPIRPDFILLNDFKPDYSPFISGIKEVEIPVGIIMHDLQYKQKKRKSFIEKENIRYIFSHYRDAFFNRFPEFKERMIWFPHHVPTHIFKDYKQRKTIHWLFMGASYPHIYPLRTKIITTMRKVPGFVQYDHPGYHTFKNKQKHVLIGERYAREINRAKMLLTSQSVYRFPVLKYFEGAASNTLVMGDGSKELEDLGFIDGETYVELNERNIFAKANDYLRHEKQRLNIAARGYEMVRKFHSTEKRANDLIKHINQILKNRHLVANQ